MGNCSSDCDLKLKLKLNGSDHLEYRHQPIKNSSNFEAQVGVVIRWLFHLN